MKNKYNYEKPQLEIINIFSDDIITTSIGDAPFSGEDDELEIRAGKL